MGVSLHQYLVYVAPAPVFAGLKRLDDWMVCSVEVFRGMFVLRRITAAYVPTLETETQVYPCIPDFQTILAPIRAGCNLPDSVKMCT
jgi:hypothetical protein